MFYFVNGGSKDRCSLSTISENELALLFKKGCPPLYYSIPFQINTSFVLVLYIPDIQIAHDRAEFRNEI